MSWELKILKILRKTTIIEGAVPAELQELLLVTYFQNILSEKHMQEDASSLVFLSQLTFTCSKSQ